MAKAFFKKTTLFATAFVLAVSTLTAAVPFILSKEAAATATPYSQSFEYGSSDWSNSTIVDNGADGFAASEGSHYARVSSGAFTGWGNDRSRATFPVGGSSTSLDLFLYMDTASNGADLRVDYSSAINNQSGTHLRDFIFHLGTDPTTPNQWLVSTSNNSPGNPSVGDNLKITQDGWYTLKQDFKNVNDVLVVTMSVARKSDGQVLKTWTLSTPTDLISSVVGGNRYGWFTGNRFDIPYVAIDNAQLTLYNAPQPTAPQNGGVTTSANGSATFGWNSVAGATGYEVRYSQGPSRTPNNVDGELTNPLGTPLVTTDTSVTETNLPGGTLFWQVRGIFDGANGPWSNIWTTTIGFERNVTVTPDTLNGWALTQTDGGVSSLKTVTSPVEGVGALNLVTDANNNSRAAAVLTANDVKLKDLSDLSYKTRQNASSLNVGDAAYRFNFDADGDLATTNDRATMVYEPYWQTSNTSQTVQPNVWQTWDVDSGVFWASIPGGNAISGLQNGAGGPPLYTLSTLQGQYPNAKVLTFSTGIGSYNANYNIDVDQFVVGLFVNNSYTDKTTYDFEPDTTAPAAPVLNNSPVYVNASQSSSQATWTHDGADVASFEYREYMSQAAADADADGNTASYWIVTKSASDRSQTVGQSWTGEQTLYYRVVAIDAAGNRTVSTTLGMVIIDKVAPTVTITGQDDETSTPTLRGTAQGAATSVFVKVNNGAEQEVAVTNGLWSYTVPQALSAGTYTITAVAKDAANNRTTIPASRPFVVASNTATTPVTDNNTDSNSGTNPDAGTILIDQDDNTTPAFGFPLATSPASAAVLGNATDDSNAANNGAGVEGASTENADTLAAADTEANKGSFLGLGWYWWILIIAALAAIAWWIAAAVRKRQEA